MIARFDAGKGDANFAQRFKMQIAKRFKMQIIQR